MLLCSSIIRTASVLSVIDYVRVIVQKPEPTLVPLALAHCPGLNDELQINRNCLINRDGTETAVYCLIPFDVVVNRTFYRPHFPQSAVGV